MGKLAKEQVRAKIGLTEAGIIASLLERSTYALNEKIYVPGGVVLRGANWSFFESIFRGKEMLFSSHGCFKDGREHPFFPKESLGVRQIAVRQERSGEEEVPRVVSKNKELMRIYMRMLREICKPGDEEKDYGSCADLDSDGLRRLSYRVHYGEVVAESKLLENPGLFVPLIRKNWWGNVRGALRDEDTEKTVVGRVLKKCEALGLEPRLAGIISGSYNSGIMPLTLDVEVEYLKMQRESILERFPSRPASD